MKKTLYIAFVLAGIFSVAGNINAQTYPEQLVPLRSNPAQAADAARIAAQRNSPVAVTADTLAFPSQGIRDNFSYESHRPDTSLWELNFNNPPLEIEPSGVFVNRTWAIAPINLGVCTFDGIKWNGEPYNQSASVNSTGQCDDLVSKPINLSTLSIADSVYLTFWYEAKGRGYAPNAQDSFLLDFNIPAWNPAQFDIVWKNIWYKEGYSPSSADSNFRIVKIKLDSASYFTNGFRFRFHNYASQCGSNDHWHLDEISLKKNVSYRDSLSHDVDFVYNATSAIKDFWAVPNTHYKPSMMNSNFGVSIRNNDTDAVGRSYDYSYAAYDENNVLVPSAYSAGTLIAPRYAVSGYANTTPPINFSYSAAAVNADTTTFVTKHYLHSSNDYDTMVVIQKFYNYYAYDDGTAETGYGLVTSNSSLAYKFTMPSSMPVGSQDTLKAVQMYFLPVMDIVNLQQRTFTLKVWSDQGNQPGTVLYSQRTQSPEYAFDTPDRFVTYGIDSGIVLLQAGQTYYIGWEQQAADRLFIGMDFNDDHHDKIYFNTSGNWNTSIYAGSLMMRPVFGNNYDATAIAEHNTEAAFSVYPNPANDHITISGLKADAGNCDATILDVAGRSVMPAQLIQNNSLDVSALSNGLYFVQLRNEKGELLGTQRLVISE